jgi:hypothetical protein
MKVLTIVGLAAVALGGSGPAQADEPRRCPKAVRSPASTTMTFDEFESAWNAQALQLLDSALAYVSALETVPCPDGVFHYFVKKLLVLPFKERHVPLIIRLLGRADPHLQEAGVELAGASAGRLAVLHLYENPLRAILAQKDLDPWVLQALNQHFLPQTIYAHRQRIPAFFRAYASVAYGPEPAPKLLPAIQRTRPIHPYADARSIIEHRIAASTSADEEIEAMLPIVEKAIGVAGYAAVRKALIEKDRLPIAR